METRIDELAQALEALRVSVAKSSTAHTSAAGARAAGDLLKQRPVEKEISSLLEVVGKTRVPREDGEPKPLRPSRLPPQPMFNGADFPLFLSRYKRWMVVSGLEGLSEDQNRSWFMASMEDQVLSIAESIYNRTETFEDLVQQLSRVYPVILTDFTLRKMSKIFRFYRSRCRKGGGINGMRGQLKRGGFDHNRNGTQMRVIPADAHHALRGFTFHH